MNLTHDQCQAWEEEIARLKERIKELESELASRPKMEKENEASF